MRPAIMLAIMACPMAPGAALSAPASMGGDAQPETRAITNAARGAVLLADFRLRMPGLAQP
ncbi:MAG: hypothetical protein CFE45_24250 [Burkholderiales bacterium PBB5]|nr:MAG: hypothetical protein CFE45_24250 [Burkholderiales bacterium PBB5]